MRTPTTDGKEGMKIKSTFQTAKVTRPLWSVGKICDEGLEVKFNKLLTYFPVTTLVFFNVVAEKSFVYKVYWDLPFF